MKGLSVADRLVLPVDLVTHVTLLCGKRGSGKTNSAKRLVEQAVRVGVPVAVIDPADVWYGLRAGRDGKAGGGLPVHVFGGRHQDLPLESTAGALLADVVVEQRVSVVMAVREFSGQERARFVTDFAERLIRRNTEPLLLVVEEAHEVMPQTPYKGEERSLGALLKLVTLGRSSGIGLLELTQRLARLHKTATTQADVLFAHRTIGPQDRDALEEWIKYHQGGAQRAAFMEALPALKTGEAWLWGPDFPEDKPLGLARVSVLECETFNSHATPKVGETRREPKALAKVDLDRLRVKMAATIERAKADDPRELRRQIAELKRQQQTRTSPRPYEKSATVREKRVDVPVLKDGQLARVEAVLQRIEMLGGRLTALASSIGDAIIKTRQPVAPAVLVRAVSVRPAHAPQKPVHPPVASGDIRLNRAAERKVLQVLAVHGPRTKRQLAIQAGYAMGGGGFLGALSKLKTAGLLQHNGAGTLAITDAGLATIGDVEPLPTGPALVAYWLQQFNRRAEREVLRVLVEAYPDTLTAEGIASSTQPPYEPKGGGFLGAVSKLRTLGLIEGRGELRASESLFS